MEKTFIITACNHTMDMSVGNINSNTLEIPYADLRPGMEITVEGMEKCGCTEITAVSEEMVAVRWSGHDYEIRLGDKMKSDGILCHNIYLSVDEIYMEYSFEEKTMWDKAREMIISIGNIHNSSSSPVHSETAGQEQEVLKIIEDLIDGGEIGMYPLYALLNASNNWYSGAIVRLSQFREILLEGIGKGCLAPDCSEGWEWLRIAADCNDPAEFMTDMERYYNIIMDAVANGDENAREIMDTIWEPEQEIEED